MGIAEATYASFKRLKDKVLNPAVAEVNRVSDFRVTVDYQRESRKITALKFKMRRVALLPGAQHDQGTLFPDLDDMPPAVKELKDTGVSLQDALEVWQQGFDYVQEKVRPAELGEDPEAAFVHYLREKIHLLKRRQASGKVANSTGFLLDALKKNYANPEFAEEQQQQQARQHAQQRRAKARDLAALQEQREQTKRTHSDALHAHCQAMVEASPALLDEAVTVLLAQNPAFRGYYQPDKSPLENYRARAFVYLPIEGFLTKHYPEHFQALFAAHNAELAALDEKIALAQAV